MTNRELLVDLDHTNKMTHAEEIVPDNSAPVFDEKNTEDVIVDNGASYAYEVANDPHRCVPSLPLPPSPPCHSRSTRSPAIPTDVE